MKKSVGKGRYFEIVFVTCHRGDQVIIAELLLEISWKYTKSILELESR